MADLVNFKVARAHLGDEITEDGPKPKHFEEGDTRLADPTVVATLVDRGVLVAPKGAKMDSATETKVEPPLKNKAEPISKVEPKTATTKTVGTVETKGDGK